MSPAALPATAAGWGRSAAVAHQAHSCQSTTTAADPPSCRPPPATPMLTPCSLAALSGRRSSPAVSHARSWPLPLIQAGTSRRTSSSQLDRHPCRTTRRAEWAACPACTGRASSGQTGLALVATTHPMGGQGHDGRPGATRCQHVPGTPLNTRRPAGWVRWNAHAPPDGSSPGCRHVAPGASRHTAALNPIPVQHAASVGSASSPLPASARSGMLPGGGRPGPCAVPSRERGRQLEMRA